MNFRWPVLIVCAAAALADLRAAEDKGKLPPSARAPVDFNRDIKPILENSCFRCHGPEKPKSHFRLDNRASALQGGDDNADDIVPGDSTRSKLIYYVARQVKDMEMPPAGKGDPLTTEQIGLLRDWIDQGANWPADSLVAQRETTVSVSPTARWVSVNGNKQKFREDWGQKEGFTAGYEHFEMHEPAGKDAELEVEGRALFDQNDYRVALTLTQPELGFVRAGYDTHREYFDDTGGFYSGFVPSSFDSGRDLHLDIGKAWVELGLTLPDWPRMTLGYEYQFREGAKSTLQWGNVQNGAINRNIFPAWTGIGERVHIIKFDLDHEMRGWRFTDSFRGEFYRLETHRVNDLAYNLSKPGPEKFVSVDEGADYFQGANAIQTEKQLCDWLFVSGGYLYTRMDGNASFRQSTETNVYAALPPAGGFIAGGFSPDRFWFSNQILINQQSHVCNVNALLGPWRGLSFSAGLQNEWGHQEGFGDARLDQGAPPLSPNPAILDANMDRTTFEENFGLRYTEIPFTVLFADTRFQQENLSQFEHDTAADTLQGFLRDTDAASDLKQARAGFNISPWSRVSLDASYQWRDKRSDYDHVRDEGPAGAPGLGYSAFIRSRDIREDDVTAKLSVRVTTWLRTAFQYQLTATDFQTVTDPGVVVVAPGGAIDAGHYDAHTFSVSAAVTPSSRLYLNSSFSYQQARTVTWANNAASVVPYRGDVYSIVSGATFALNSSTSLQGTYTFSRADFAQDNAVAGLPAGIEYDRHELRAGITRRLLKNMTGTLQYAFFRYDEPASGGANNYRAHAIMASLNINLP